MTFPKLTACFTAVAALAAPVMAEPQKPTTAVIIADLSPENRALTDPSVNETIQIMLADHLAKLDLAYGDRAIFRAFGSPGGNPRPLPDWHKDVTFEYSKFGATDPRYLAPRTRQLITGLSEATPAEKTDLHWSLTRLANEIDCAKAEVHYILVSNLVEAGRFDPGGYALLPFASGTFEGCKSITIAGFDAAFLSGSADALTTAEGAWAETFQDAGFEDVYFSR